VSPRVIRDEGNPGREPISGTFGGPCTGTVTATLTFGGIASGDVAFAGVPGSETVLHEHKRTGVILDDRPRMPSGTGVQFRRIPQEPPKKAPASSASASIVGLGSRHRLSQRTVEYNCGWMKPPHFP
jgi:hypothetical protein